MSNVNTSITYSLDTGLGSLSDNDFLWLEQVEEEETMSLGEAAQMIDSAYDLNPCNPIEQVVTTPTTDTSDSLSPEDGLYDAAVGYADFVKYVQDQIDLFMCSIQPALLTMDIKFKVVRGNTDLPYELKVPVSMIASTTTVSEVVEKTHTVTGSRGVQLDYPVVILNPYTDFFKASWIGTPEVEAGKSNSIIREGNSLTWEGEVYGSLRVEYTTEYDVVTLRVPYTEAETSAEYHVVAFYNRMAAETDLDKPVPEVDAVDRSLYCSPGIGAGGGLTVGDGDGDGDDECKAQVTTITYCSCSGKVAARSEPAESIVPCPDYTEGGSYDLGSTTLHGGYTHCPGEEEEQDPDAYKRTCCKAGAGPMCNTWYTKNTGVPIDPSVLKSLAEAGKNPIAVYPKDGDCGTVTHTYVKGGTNCCDEVIPMSESPTNPDYIAPNTAVSIAVVDGNELTISDWKWEATGGLRFSNGNSSITGGRIQTVYAPEETCSNATTVRVDDECNTLSIPLGTDPVTELSLCAENIEFIVAPNGYIGFTASGGVPPYHYAAGKLQHLGDGLFQAPDDFCGTDTVTVSDSCTEIAECDVASTVGHWEIQVPPDYDGSEFFTSIPFSAEVPPDGSGNPPENAYVTATGWSASIRLATFWYRCETLSGLPPGNLLDTVTGLKTPEQKCTEIAADYPAEYNMTWDGGCCTAHPDEGLEHIEFSSAIAQGSAPPYKWICAT